MIADATGIPLAATLTGGNRNDVTQLIPLLQAVPPVWGERGRPRRRPNVVLTDRGYDRDKYRRLVWDLGEMPTDTNGQPPWRLPVGAAVSVRRWSAACCATPPVTSG
ncbi:hypothetical protein SUDANB126_07017 [Streptomyces sp. enrichment culture]